MNNLEEYHAIIASKKIRFSNEGITKDITYNDSLFPYQRDCVEFALAKGRTGLFLDTGLGKSIVSFNWAYNVSLHTNKPVLMLCPLGVALQHVNEAAKFGYNAVVIRDGVVNSSYKDIVIANYESLEKFDVTQFGGIILDESSILKSFTGVIKNKLVRAFKNTEFKLAATATPSPNDLMELGNHSDFLNVMRSSEMLARWFITDQATMGKYRLKKPGIKDYWEWVASWSRAISKPSDMGYSDEGFILPELKEFIHTIQSDLSEDRGEEKDGQLRLIRIPDVSATAIHKEKRMSNFKRAEKAAELVNGNSDYFTVWCDTDYEADELKKAIPSAIDVRGSMKLEEKEELLASFSSGESRVIITKPRIAGYGLNWQHCHNTIFAGISHSYEKKYQCVRRHYRYGQKNTVNCHIIQSDTEERIMEVVSRKEIDHNILKREMTAAMKRASHDSKVLTDYTPTKKTILPSFLRNE
jgi:SNF2 family DNA or RNA helicase